jgi:putative hydrolase of the HAD superfamily
VITHVFFDIGGVLGTNGWDREQRDRAIAEFGLEAEDFHYRHKEVVGAWEEGEMSLDEYLDVTIWHRERPFRRDAVVRFMREQSAPDAATIDVARALAARGGVRLMTLNNESLELNRHRIERFGLREIFSAVLSSCWLGARKPSRRIYERALGIAQAEPTRSLFIDDREQNLAPARALGMRTLRFEGAPALATALRAMGL